MLKKLLKILSNTLLVLLVSFLLVLAVSFLPLPGNFRAFVVQSGSMEPTVRTGSLIFVKPTASYEIGDVINIKNGKSSVTHRIVGKKMENGTAVFETKGDANEEADVDLIPQTKIFGKMFWTLPLIGYPVALAKTQKGFLFLVIIPSVIIIYEEIRKIKDEMLRMFLKNKFVQGNKETEDGKEHKISVTQNNLREQHVLDLRLRESKIMSKKRRVA